MVKGGRLQEHSAQNIYKYAGSDQIEVLGTSLNLAMIMQAEMYISTIGSASVSWWLQVEEVYLSSERDESAPSQAVALNYNKDEELVETFL